MMEPVADQSPATVGTSPAIDLWRRYSYILLTVVPLAYLLWVLVKYGVDVPVWDQWDLVPLLDKMYSGKLTLADVWAQHNEHRPMFPLLVMLGLARLTRWNILYELAVNIVLAVGVFAVLTCQIRQTARNLGMAGLRWAIPASALIVFSVSQYQNWLFGWQIQMLLNLLAVLAGITLLANGAFSWSKFAGAAALGILATYSFANGLLFWPIGLGILLVVAHGRRTVAACAWLLVSLVTVGSYLWHYQKPAEHPALSSIFTMPLAYAGYVLKFIGNPGAQYYTGPLLGQQGDGDLALIAGLLGTLSLAWAAVLMVRLRLTQKGVMLPYLAIVAYSIGTAMVTGLGRVGFGSDQALESRYGCMVVPFWVTLVVALLVLMQRDRRPSSAPGGSQQSPGGTAYYRRVAAGSLLAGAMVLLALSSLGAREGGAAMSGVQASCRSVLLDMAGHPGTQVDVGSLDSQGPYAQKAFEGYPVLVRHRLSLFRVLR
jgi:hypothetical protein